MKTQPLGYFAGFDGSKLSTSGGVGLLVYCGNRFFARVISGMPHQMHKLVEPWSRSFTDSLALYGLLHQQRADAVHHATHFRGSSVEVIHQNREHHPVTVNALRVAGKRGHV